jgi:hypothetical protein
MHSYSDLSGFDPIPNNQPWIFAGLATDLVDNPQDLSGCSFAFDVIDGTGQTVLTATTANGKFFMVEHAGAIGWAFSTGEVSKLPAGTYRTKLEVSKDGESEPVHVGTLMIFDGD